MATLNPRYLSKNFFQIREEYRRYKELDRIFTNHIFTAKEFKEYEHRYALYSIDTYRKDGIISVAYSEDFTVYGTKDEWGDFEICHGMTDEIYNILPSQIQDLIIVQKRKRNHYQINCDAFVECKTAYEALKFAFGFKD